MTFPWRALALLTGAQLAFSSVLASQARRDLLLGRSDSGSARVDLWTSSAALNAFAPLSPLLAPTPGTMVAIERDDLGAMMAFLAVDQPGVGTLVYEQFLPFMRFCSSPQDEMVRYAARRPEAILDFKIDPGVPNDPNRTQSLVLLVVDTSTARQQLRRVPLLVSVPPVSAPIGVSGGATQWTLAVSNTTGDVFVGDDAGRLQTFDALLGFQSATVLNLAVRDLHWRRSTTNTHELLAAGTTLAPAASGIFRIDLPSGTATAVASLPAPPTALTLDAYGNGYCLAGAAPSQIQVWAFDALGNVTPTNHAPGPYGALSWTSRAVRDPCGGSGTPISCDIAPVFVGDRELTYRVLTPPHFGGGPFGMLWSTDWTRQGPSLGPEATIYLDLAAVGLRFDWLPGTLPGNASATVRVPAPIVPQFHGARLATQFLAFDGATNRPFAAEASVFVIGLRPVD